jgi:hypothetical protein
MVLRSFRNGDTDGGGAVTSKPLRGPVPAVTSDGADDANPCGDQVFPHVVRISGGCDPTAEDDPLDWCDRNCRGGWRWSLVPGDDGPWYTTEFEFENTDDAVWFELVWG